MLSADDVDEGAGQSRDDVVSGGLNAMSGRSAAAMRTESGPARRVAHDCQAGLGGQQHGQAEALQGPLTMSTETMPVCPCWTMR